VFNVNVFIQKYSNCTFEDDESLEVYNDIIRSFAMVNVDWSRTDSYMMLVGSYSFAVRLMVSAIWGVCREQKLECLDLTQVFDLMLEISDMLTKPSESSFVQLSYKTELANMISHIASCWIPIARTDLKADAISSKLIELLNALEPIFSANLFLGDNEVWTNASFIHIFECLLVVFEALGKVQDSSNIIRKNAALKNKLDMILKTVFPAICKTLYFLLSDPKPENERDRSIILGCLFQLCRMDDLVPIHVWNSSIEKFQTIPLLLTMFSTWAVNQANILDCSFPEQIIEVLLCFATRPVSAEQLVSNGVIACFSNNFLTPQLMEGNLESYNNQGRSQLHRIWCLKLAVVSQLLRLFGNNVEFFEQSIGFARLYEKQRSSGSNANKRQSLSLGNLEELERLTEMFYELGRNIQIHSGMAEIHWVWMSDFQDNCLRLLSMYGFLFKSPLELLSRFKALPQEQKGFGVKLDRESCTFVEIKMITITRNILSFLRLSTQVNLLLSADLSVNTVPNVSLILQPTMGSFGDQIASFGTMFDIIRHFVQKFRKGFGRAKYGMADSVLIVETGLAIVAVQIILLNYCDADFADVQKELVNEYFETLKDFDALTSEPNQDNEILAGCKEFLTFLANLETRIIMRW
jgi:hypothetical protein